MKLSTTLYIITVSLLQINRIAALNESTDHKQLQCGKPSTKHRSDLFKSKSKRSINTGDEKTKKSKNKNKKFGKNKNSSIKNRIIGGKKSEKGIWPWYVQIKYQHRKNDILCGGTIINYRFVLTAAHCLDAKATKLIFAHDGFAFADKYEIKSEIQHGQWDKKSKNFKFDIGLVQTKKSITFTKHTRPICLPDNDVTFQPETKCVIAGFGKTSERVGGIDPDHLRDAVVELYDDKTCKNRYKDLTEIDSLSQICAGSDHGVDSCQGDSGGPLVCRVGKDMPWVLYGIVSFGIGCGHREYPGVYTKVPNYTKWIKDNTKDNFENSIVTTVDFPCTNKHSDKNKNGSCGQETTQFYDRVEKTNNNKVQEPTDNLVLYKCNGIKYGEGQFNIEKLLMNTKTMCIWSWSKSNKQEKYINLRLKDHTCMYYYMWSVCGDKKVNLCSVLDRLGLNYSNSAMVKVTCDIKENGSFSVSSQLKETSSYYTLKKLWPKVLNNGFIIDGSNDNKGN